MSHPGQNNQRENASLSLTFCFFFSKGGFCKFGPFDVIVLPPVRLTGGRGCAMREYGRILC